MTAESIAASWSALPEGARTALEQQWAALAAGGLPCGAGVVDATGAVVARGRNRAHDAASGGPLSGTPIAHAELNALAGVTTDADTSGLTVFSTQHPCAMCAAALAFTGVGRVVYIADDPSDDSSPSRIAATRGAVTYQRLGSVEWAIVTTILFLYAGAELRGEADGTLRAAAADNPALGALVLAEAVDGRLGRAARSGIPLHEAVAPLWELFA